MKKLFIVIVLLMLVVILLFTSRDINRIGKDNVYVEVIDYTNIEETKLDSGEIITRYIYNQKAFDEEGKSVEIEFTAGKILRQEAYLMLYVKNGNEVTSYDEVEWDEIPSIVQGELENYYGGN